MYNYKQAAMCISCAKDEAPGSPVNSYDIIPAQYNIMEALAGTDEQQRFDRKHLIRRRVRIEQLI